MIGRLIDRFRVVGKLGQGGMGSVWRAEDTLLHRPVALKILGEEWSQAPSARRRFLREARAASSLSQPCIATVYGAGRGRHGGVHRAGRGEPARLPRRVFGWNSELCILLPKCVPCVPTR
jgi:serine/threonine protein kinase